MLIGNKLKELRLLNMLTQQEVADRCELSKGHISQLERDMTSPSISTLIDILTCLGSNLKEFFNAVETGQIVFRKEEMFENENAEKKHEVTWLVPNAQKNNMEPILVTLHPDGETSSHSPHEGEEFGYVLEGRVELVLGNVKHKARKGDSFYFKSSLPHTIKNTSNRKAVFLWVSNPPSF
ncbi:MAG: XRE family transcriptional regulator [Clostridia bacterium]